MIWLHIESRKAFVSSKLVVTATFFSIVVNNFIISGLLEAAREFSAIIIIIIIIIIVVVIRRLTDSYGSWCPAGLPIANALQLTQARGLPQKPLDQWSAQNNDLHALVVGGGNEYDDGGDNDEKINDFVNDSDC